MKYLIAKLVAASFFVFQAVGQTIDPNNPGWGWTDYKQLKCDEGYNKVSNYCVKCNSGAGKYFDPVSKQCRTCPEGTKFSATTKACECECAAPRLINPTTKACQCSGGRIFVNNQCQCPENKPLWNGKNCVACPPGTTFEPQDKQCYHCPEGFAADPVTHHCSPAL